MIGDHPHIDVVGRDARAKLKRVVIAGGPPEHWNTVIARPLVIADRDIADDPATIAGADGIVTRTAIEHRAFEPCADVIVPVSRLLQNREDLVEVHRAAIIEANFADCGSAPRLFAVPKEPVRRERNDLDRVRSSLYRDLDRVLTGKLVTADRIGQHPERKIVSRNSWAKLDDVGVACIPCIDVFEIANPHQAIAAIEAIDVLPEPARGHGQLSARAKRIDPGCPRLHYLSTVDLGLRQ